MSSAILNIEIIVEKKSWQNLLNKVKFYDFYHTYDYHYLSKSNDEKPILIKYESKGNIIGLPLLLRRIFDTDYFDVTSVYGYVGPIHNNLNAAFDNFNFKNQLNQFFIKNNIISVFSRLNPYICDQDLILKGIGDLVQLGRVVNIDLTKTLDDQRHIFSKTTKRYINKGKKQCSIRLSNSKADVSTFIKLYYENMDRVNAKKGYYFTKDYFDYFINSNDFQTDLLLAIYNETKEIISAAMMIKTNDIIQYHISGTRNDYLHLTPVRLLIDEMRVRGTLEGYQYFNLGGGLGSVEDSLFRFKSSFSKDFKNFEIWKYIVNQEVYDQLTDQFSDLNAEGDFFPKYRSDE